MKMTMHINEILLERVIAATGASSKTQAVDLALRELDRRAELVRLTMEGLDLTPNELRDMVDPAYDLEKIRSKETPKQDVRKSRSGR